VWELKRSIDEFLEASNEDSDSFLWRATVESMMEKIARARARMQELKPGSSFSRDCRK
jgi:hypothetical protein